MWKYHGSRRHPFARQPGPGQESVWDYPRPPVLVPDKRHVTVSWRGLTVVETSNAMRILETASPPSFYFPPESVNTTLLQAARGGGSFCEWKGEACYWTLAVPGHTLERAGWSYPSPKPAFAAIAGWIAFYPQQLDCRVEQQKVEPQGGGFYGGWVTAEIIGPWKGQSGTGGW